MNGFVLEDSPAVAPLLAQSAVERPQLAHVSIQLVKFALRQPNLCRVEGSIRPNPNQGRVDGANGEEQVKGAHGGERGASVLSSS